ncbi:MAG: AAA family ATPase [Candidatus Calescibacterium sp.]|nr:AAA family ATPase [Candidatus Calescibacterium sp.]MDW8195915.1 AAA family ATPase [Candidatus Calescibacterium sp.]
MIQLKYKLITKVDPNQYRLIYHSQPKDPVDEKNFEIQNRFNSIIEEIRKVDIAPQKRGFFRFQYYMTTTSNISVSDLEVASIIASSNKLQIDISYYLEEIASLEFRVYTSVGSGNSPSVSFLQTRPKGSREFTSIVNEGFGINQLVYMLAKILYQGNKLVMIEEPEVHLHPEIIRNFIRNLCKILSEYKGKKQIIITTHSENVVSALLGAVKQKIITPEDIKAYLVKENGETRFIKQEVNQEGRIEGGLANFAIAQLEDIKILLDIHDE